MNWMKRISLNLFLAGLTAAGFQVPAVAAEENPQTPAPKRSDATASSEALCLHSLFQSNMVLQRDKPLSIWGWAPAGEEVTVSFGGQKQTAKAATDTSWKVVLPAMPANATPQQLVVQGKAQTITLDNILIGDIWVMGGQSNMQHPLSNCEDGAVEIACAHFPQIRLLTIPALIDHHEKKNFPRRQKGKQPDGDWDVCSPQTVFDFSGIGYAFVRRIHMASQVPIGAIDASYWGTTLESWTPRSVLESMTNEAVRAVFAEWEKKAAGWDPQKDLADRVKRYYKLRVEKKDPSDNPPTDLRGGPGDDQNNIGTCYASVIAPIAGFSVKGAIWHQGFNNSRADASSFYYQVFPKMIGAWRAAFNDPKMAFGIISLCTDSAPQTLDNYLECMLDYGIDVREAQYKTFLDLYQSGDKNIGFASSFDFRRAWYHPQEKIPAAERIARWAMATQYGIKAAPWLPPMIKKMESKDGALLLQLDKEVDSVDKQAIAGFSIAGEDGKFQPAQAEHLVTGKDTKGQPKRDLRSLVLRSPYVPNPIHFRYAWGRNPMGNLRMASTAEKDNAFAPQRSDSWSMADMYQAYTGKKSASPETITRPEMDELRKALQAADLARRIADARALLENQSPQNK
jgi:sialate O-acetylesterase